MLEPFAKKKKWITELVNEQIILATIYFAMCFSDLATDPSVQTMLGYAFCGMLATHISSYLLMMTYKTVKKFIARYKRKKFIRLHKEKWNGKWLP